METTLTLTLLASLLLIISTCTLMNPDLGSSFSLLKVHKASWDFNYGHSLFVSFNNMCHSLFLAYYFLFSCYDLSFTLQILMLHNTLCWILVFIVLSSCLSFHESYELTFCICPACISTSLIFLFQNYDKFIWNFN